jgi:hypothetical protein
MRMPVASIPLDWQALFPRRPCALALRGHSIFRLTSHRLAEPLLPPLHPPLAPPASKHRCHRVTHHACSTSQR